MTDKAYTGLGIPAGTPITSGNVNSPGSGDTVSLPVVTGTPTLTTTRPNDVRGTSGFVIGSDTTTEVVRFDLDHAANADGQAIQFKMTPGGNPTNADWPIVMSRSASNFNGYVYHQATTSPAGALAARSAAGTNVSSSVSGSSTVGYTPALGTDTYRVDFCLMRNTLTTPSTSNGRIMMRVRNLTNPTSWNGGSEFYLDTGYTTNVLTDQGSYLRFGKALAGSLFPDAIITDLRWKDIATPVTSLTKTAAIGNFLGDPSVTVSVTGDGNADALAAASTPVSEESSGTASAVVSQRPAVAVVSSSTGTASTSAAVQIQIAAASSSSGTTASTYSPAAAVAAPDSSTGTATVAVSQRPSVPVVQSSSGTAVAAVQGGQPVGAALSSSGTAAVAVSATFPVVAGSAGTGSAAAVAAPAQAVAAPSSSSGTAATAVRAPVAAAAGSSGTAAGTAAQAVPVQAAVSSSGTAAAGATPTAQLSASSISVGTANAAAADGGTVITVTSGNGTKAVSVAPAAAVTPAASSSGTAAAAVTATSRALPAATSGAGTAAVTSVPTAAAAASTSSAGTTVGTVAPAAAAVAVSSGSGTSAVTLAGLQVVAVVSSGTGTAVGTVAASQPAAGVSSGSGQASADIAQVTQTSGAAVASNGSATVQAVMSIPMTVIRASAGTVAASSVPFAQADTIVTSEGTAAIDMAVGITLPVAVDGNGTVRGVVSLGAFIDSQHSSEGISELAVQQQLDDFPGRHRAVGPVVSLAVAGSQFLRRDERFPVYWFLTPTLETGAGWQVKIAGEWYDLEVSEELGRRGLRLFVAGEDAPEADQHPGTLVLPPKAYPTEIRLIETDTPDVESIRTDPLIML